MQVTSKLDSKDKHWQLPKCKHYHGQVKRQYNVAGQKETGTTNWYKLIWLLREQRERSD